MEQNSTLPTLWENNNPIDIVRRGDFSSKVYNGVYKNQEVHVMRISGVFEDQRVINDDINRLLSINNQQNIVSYFHGSFLNHDLVLVFEKMEINLKQFISRGICSLSATEIIVQVGKGLQFLHQNSIVHGFLKPTTVLLNLPSNSVKLSEFGMNYAYSKLLQGYWETESCSELADWMAPEILILFESGNFKTLGTYQADMFSLGCVFYYALSNGKHAFGDIVERVYNILKNEPYLDKSCVKMFEISAFSIITLLLSKKTRPSIEIFMNHPALWPDSKTYNFFKCVLIANTEVDETKKILTFLQYVLAETISSFWEHKLTSELKLYFSALAKPCSNTITNILESITYIYENFSTLPPNVIEVVGKQPNHCIKFFNSQVAFLVEAVWVVLYREPSFENLCQFYPHGCVPISAVLLQQYPGLEDISVIAQKIPVPIIRTTGTPTTALEPTTTLASTTKAPPVPPPMPSPFIAPDMSSPSTNNATINLTETPAQLQMEESVLPPPTTNTTSLGLGEALAKFKQDGSHSKSANILCRDKSVGSSSESSKGSNTGSHTLQQVLLSLRQAVYKSTDEEDSDESEWSE